MMPAASKIAAMSGFSSKKRVVKSQPKLNRNSTALSRTCRSRSKAGVAAWTTPPNFEQLESGNAAL